MKDVEPFKDLVLKEGDMLPLSAHRRCWLNAGCRQDLRVKEGDAIAKYIKRIKRDNHAPG
ncbi:MAG: hypothetical protein MRY79_00775 [Alphaproteobacteria bacterium]|nr:hypothetical protein [Alphaproteobacteria bacterium]